MPESKKRPTAFVVAMAVLIATPLAVGASDSFTDVPDSNVHHADITWLADTGVTLGCNPPDNTNFCPGDPVLRQQMASFLRRLAENQVVDAATAVTAGTAYEAVRDESVSVMDNALNPVSIATLDLEPGSYVLSTTLTAHALPGGPGVPQSLVECELAAGDRSVRGAVQIGINAGNAMYQTMSLTMTAVADQATQANLSCWRPSGIGDERPEISAGARVIAYPVSTVVSTSVDQ